MPKRIPATIAEISAETPTVKRFLLDLQQEPFHFLPGQWLDLYIEVDGHVAVGGYSITSSQRESGLVELAIKLPCDKHPVTEFLYHQAQPGDTVEIYGGQGACVYRREMGDQMVLIAGGIGITPLMSMIRSIQDLFPEVGILLLYSAKVPEEFVFRTELREREQIYANFHCLYTITATPEEYPEWTGQRGRFGRESLSRLGLSGLAHYFVCGPTGMVTALEQALAEAGVPAERIHYEKW